jgi:integrase/recombinase XerC/integrase/recombinase XerD
MLPARGVRVGDAVRIYLATITVANTRTTYTAALDRLVADFGADTNVALLGSEPDRVSDGSRSCGAANRPRHSTSG